MADHFNINMKNAYEKSKAEVLPQHVANNLENTDAHEGITLQKSKHLLGKYGRSTARQQHTANAFNNKKVESPIILHHIASDTYHLVSGNTRLIHARVHDITPMVHIIHI